MSGITKEAAKQALAVAVAALSGMADTSIFLDATDAGRAVGDHLLITMQGDIQVGYLRRPSSARTSPEQNRQMTVQIDAFGESVIGGGAVTALHAVAAQLISDVPAALALYAAGVSVQSVGEVNDITALFRSGHEPRATLTIRAGYVWVGPTAAESTPATSIIVDIESEGGVTVDANAVVTVTV